MINNHYNKLIKLLYDKRGEVWTLGLIEASEGVSEMLGGLPHFDTASSQPHRLHVKLILDTLAKAGLDGGHWAEIWADDRYETTIEIKQRPGRHLTSPRSEASATG